MYMCTLKHAYISESRWAYLGLWIGFNNAYFTADNIGSADLYSAIVNFSIDFIGFNYVI